MPGNFLRLTGSKAGLDSRDLQVLAQVCGSVPGYSDARHALFYKRLFAETDVATILMLGVYFGRDIVLMLEAARRAGRTVAITGVDKFSDDACEDWPVAARNQGWEQAGFGRAPTFAAAAGHIGPHIGTATVGLISQLDDLFLSACRARFDLIYLDTSHDHATVRRQLRQAVGLLTQDGLLAGDDYSDAGTWGVRRAVSEAAPGHAVVENWLWVASRVQVAAGLSVLTAI